jgi:hypothetical protein
LAASGEVQEAEWEVVKAHLQECASCRTSFSDMGAIHSACFTQAAGFEVERPPHKENQLRNSILRAASREGAQFSDQVELGNQYEKPQCETIGSFRMIRGWGIVSSLVVVCCVGVAYALRQSARVQNPTALAAARAVAPSAAQGLNGSPIEGRRRSEEILDQEVAELKAERSRIEHDLRRAENEGKNLKSVTAGMEGQIAALTTELQNTRATEAQAEGALQQLKSARESDQAAILAQNREIRSLNEQLQEQSSQKERDQDVLEAETRLRELVGARNLHIVDVYDTDPDGKTKKAVGRVFYTQGRSLVFYAYDLSTDHFDGGRYAYYVWGHREGDDQSVRNLGTLDPDDLSQKRWMLKVNDTKALSDIDRVFVTLEQNGKIGALPHGKKILSAYLGSPANHP